ncbi:MAG: hypothetical protein US57_C0002G0001 [Candidatus Moranbacteria bacterium GW2011_GWC2_37_73]|nr:MAG: hypothetical protein UR95_C0002G0099 [Parcubacteria group bacterium GW2011_GWC1_36_108]KKQ01058.1 MAG: hypothetical protein US09_C0003G0058 [Candidatus Moranbacteria bacterium GW2011_GWD1_36_198]KKQ02460.1 MAG: hypothetical protein US10_C0001G0058 [Candidatus Moranbacteria bacterium GW2011_GWD2_36_198]KKQ40294.1 MAG: hypothetical protein US57_C0002G0001 [Candidatus Moranbacteria bacterium GW2011_GWC2_37_73]
MGSSIFFGKSVGIPPHSNFLASTQGRRDFRVVFSSTLENSLPSAALNAPMVAFIDARCVDILLNVDLLSFCRFESLLQYKTKNTEDFLSPLYFFVYVGAQGFEPCLNDPKSLVLPLTPRPVTNFKHYKLIRCYV